MVDSISARGKCMILGSAAYLSVIIEVLTGTAIQNSCNKMILAKILKSFVKILLNMCN